MQASKRIANGIVGGRVAADDGYWELSAAEGQALMRSADAAEGPRAFAEKRAPSWQGAVAMTDDDAPPPAGPRPSAAWA